MPHSPLPTLEDLLTSGGDARITRDVRGMNKYGCYASAHPDILAYGSCTASTISEAAYAAAAKLYERLKFADIGNAPATYAHEMNCIRNELFTLCNLADLPSLDIIFGASGTDLHLFVAQLLHKESGSLLVIMPEPSETGSGVPMALSGPDGRIETTIIKSRHNNGDLLPATVIDAEIEAHVMRAAAKGQHVLLILTDLSKTGLIIPSPACALAMKRRFPEFVDVLVDACQFRLSNATIRAYLEQNFLLAMTGSKFVTGPAFSAALFVPKTIAQRLCNSEFPHSLTPYSVSANWPTTWTAHSALPDRANYGLLLRWKAAMVELRSFHALPEQSVRNFLEIFAAKIQIRLQNDPIFFPLPTHSLNRQPVAAHISWDTMPTIFPFRVHNSKTGRLMNRDEIIQLYEHMKTTHYQLGQPVACGALRLCVDMRLIVDALSPDGRGSDAVIAGAMRVLDKTAALADVISA